VLLFTKHFRRGGEDVLREANDLVRRHQEVGITGVFLEGRAPGPESLHVAQQSHDLLVATDSDQVAGVRPVGVLYRHGGHQRETLRAEQGVVGAGNRLDRLGRERTVLERRDDGAFLGAVCGAEHGRVRPGQHDFGEERLIAGGQRRQTGEQRFRRAASERGIDRLTHRRRLNRQVESVFARQDPGLEFAAVGDGGRGKARDHLLAHQVLRSQVGGRAHHDHRDQCERHQDNRQPGPEPAARAYHTRFDRRRGGSHRYSTSHTASPSSMRRT
jgi:hypothetical protein